MPGDAAADLIGAGARDRPVIRAVLWDVDGTLAETERDGHRVAFNRAFVECGLRWHWSVPRYGELLAVSGGRERLLHDMATRPDAPPEPAARAALAERLHRRKNALYAEQVHAAGIALRPGVSELMAQCGSRGVRMAIATTTSRANLDALLRAQLGTGWAAGFAAAVCGEDVQRKKPDGEVYQRVLAQLGLAASETLALEDSPAGCAAAVAAGVPVVITRSAYFAQANLARFAGALAVGPGLHQRTGWQPAAPDCHGAGFIGLDDLAQWQRPCQQPSSAS